MKHVEAGGRFFWLPSHSIEDPGARHDCLAHIRLVRAGLLARRGVHPGDPTWPENPYTLNPVAWSARTGEVSCNGLTWTGGCWAKGFSMVLDLERSGPQAPVIRVQCLVCGMEILSNTPYSKGEGSRIFYFCSEGHLEDFEDDPDAWRDEEGNPRADWKRK
ncbi:MAG: hypothetical protein K8T20_00805 [Planctomycetes bacterium]|nr:hypothetical protein [Planctomycetota bacterium]